MNRKDLVEDVATTSGLSTAQADAAVTAVLTAITRSVAGGERVTLPGFGSFERRERAARTGRNPQTGEAMEIAAGASPAFKPATAFKAAVSAG
ncbi:HU family DNA-binding protein [Nocardioides hwasunensis]|uniref:HU family DNA-binding protein n=1 Tax=Nocardioides hwasunensis TaxID=397258 RepID=A0ABR8MIM5_9ACTN|nr:HU family DNA-binding protein [Nocardioides hwasunensis]MBD3915913.1 HU family DNA-binding protein [Nocardioides hwasunensis]